MIVRSLSSDRAGSFVAIALRCSGWVLVNLLCAFGVLAVLAFAIGSFSLAGTMLQLANLSTRFVAADGSRQSQFGGLMAAVFIVSFCLIGFFRRKSAVAALRSEKGAN